MVKKPLLAIAGLILSAGCSVTELDFQGTYVLSRSDMIEVIEVSAGGTYRHRLEKSGSTIFEEAGYWDKDNFGDGPGITFRSFQIALQSPLKPKGYWFVLPERSWTGDLLLCADDDLCFKKLQ